MKYLLPLIFLFIGCESQKNSLSFYKVKYQDFEHIINKERLPEKPNLANYRTIQNRDYPIEIAIFEDGTWYYDLPNLDVGTGTWKYNDGQIELFAERPLFDMHINVVALKEKASIIGIEFHDRFGLKILETEKINIQE